MLCKNLSSSLLFREIVVVDEVITSIASSFGDPHGKEIHVK